MPKSSHRAEPISPDAFLRTILRSGLLDRDQLQESLRGLSSEDRPNAEEIAAHLIKAGKLSRFQARKLLQGTAMGLVLGPFQVLAPIGKGGMGTVYLARDARNHTQLVALKVLPPKRAREEERLLARFRREMEMCQRVSHPHLAWTYEVGVCQGVYYIAMEYVPGKSLYRLVAEQGPLPVPRAARLFAEVAAAIDHAHNQGLIHRDLKPSNIHITPHDHAVVLDLGLALIQGEHGADREVVGGQGYVVGTMDYVAPEQTEDACKVDARADIYALGGTLYYALTGKQPFAGGTPLEKIHRHRTEEPTPVHERNPSVPVAFALIVHKMLAKKPERRYASASAVREELLKWAEREPALPMDQPHDHEYKEAITHLRTAEPDAELVDEVLPDAELVPTAQPIPTAKLISAPGPKPAAPLPLPASRPTIPSLPLKPPDPAEALNQPRPVQVPLHPSEPGKLVFLLLAGVGVLLLGVIILAAIAQLLLH